jgi:RNA recognition motif-containing protein
MLQAGPVGKNASFYQVFGLHNHLDLDTVNVHLPKDRISMAHQGYGFCEFLTEEDAEYACKIMNQIKLWGKPIRVNKVSLCVPSLHISLIVHHVFHLRFSLFTLGLAWSFFVYI